MISKEEFSELSSAEKVDYLLNESTYAPDDVYEAFMRGEEATRGYAERKKKQAAGGGGADDSIEDWISSFKRDQQFYERGMFPPTAGETLVQQKSTGDKDLDEIAERFPGLVLGAPPSVTFFTEPDQRAYVPSEAKASASSLDPERNVQLDRIFQRKGPLYDDPESKRDGDGAEESRREDDEQRLEEESMTDEEQRIHTIAMEEFSADYARMSVMSVADVARASDSEVGEGFLKRVAKRLKAAGIQQAASTVVHKWWTQNRWRIYRDLAIGVGGTLVMGYVFPLVGLPSVGFNMFTYFKEANSMAIFGTLAATLLKSTANATKGAVLANIKTSLTGKNILGARVVQSLLERLGVSKDLRKIDAATLWSIAEVPISVALDPAMFQKLVMQPVGLWKPLLDATADQGKKKWSVAEEFFYKTLASGALKVAALEVQKKTNNGGKIASNIGAAIKSVSTAPWRLMQRMLTHPKVGELGGAFARLLAEGVKIGADYSNTAEFRMRAEEAMEEDAQDPALQAQASIIFNESLNAEVEAIEKELDEAYQREPVPVAITAEAAITPAQQLFTSSSVPPPVMEAKLVGETAGVTMSVLASMGTAVAGWVATSVALRLIGAPSVSDLAEAVPAEYANFLARHTGSFVTKLGEHVNIETTAYTLISNSIGLPGLIKKLAGNVPLPQIEALSKLEQRISKLTSKAAAENSNAIARTFMSIMLGTEIYTKKDLQKKTLEELKTLWVQKGGKITGGSIAVSKLALVSAILKQQVEASATLHRVLFDALSSQALTSAGAAALGGATKIAYSQSAGIYTAMLENDFLAGRAGLNELSARTLRAIMNDPATMDPYGIFKVSASYSREVAAAIAATKDDAMMRAYEAKRLFEEFLVGATKDLQKDVAPPPTTTELRQPPPQPLSDNGFETAEMFATRSALQAGITATGGGVPEWMAQWTKDANRATEAAIRAEDLRKEIQYHTEAQTRSYDTAFQTLAVDPKAFDAAKRLAAEALKNTESSLKDLLKNLPTGQALKALESALMAALFGAATNTAPNLGNQVKQPTSANDKQEAPVDVKQLGAIKGLYIDPLADILARRVLEAGLDAGASGLLGMLYAQGAGMVTGAAGANGLAAQLAALTGIGLSTVAMAGTAVVAGAAVYNQYAKNANKALDIAEIVRAVALATTPLKDGVLAKIPKIDTRFTELGSIKELLQKSGMWDRITEERKIDVYAVLLRETAKWSKSFLTAEPMTKMQLFTNIALELVGPPIPGVVEAVRQKSINLLVDLFMKEEGFIAELNRP